MTDRLPRVAVIGAGLGGIAAGVALHRAGFEDFVIFERSAGPGGVWWANRYPGAEVDTPSVMYSFSFHQYDWSRTHARQAELERYVRDVVERFELDARLRLDTHVRSVEWDDKSCIYRVETNDGSEHEFDAVISAVGILSEPRYPTWPGLDDFTGPCFHTSRWERQHNLDGKRVAVVGTGSTATQIVPAIAPSAAKVTVYQREPAWVDPKQDRDYTARERQKLKNTWRYRFERWRCFARFERNWIGGRIGRPTSRAGLAAETVCRSYIDDVFGDRPDLQKVVTPDYPYFGKRPVHNSLFYPALLREDVELVPQAVARVTANGVVDETGVEREADVLVLATGFQPSNFLAQIELRGRDGREIHEFWGDDASAFAGIAVPGFPNFFMLYGPNTNGYAVMFNLEQQAAFAVRSLRRMARRGHRTVEVRERAFDGFDRFVQWRLAGSSWTSARNYFRSASGRVVTQWPDGALLYWLVTRVGRRFAMRSR